MSDIIRFLSDWGPLIAELAYIRLLLYIYCPAKLSSDDSSDESSVSRRRRFEQHISSSPIINDLPIIGD